MSQTSDSSDSSDSISKAIFASDQNSELLKTIAPVVVSYFTSLVANGLSPEHAIVLVTDWHHQMWEVAFRTGGRP